MVWPAVIAAGASIIGSKIAADQRSKAASQGLAAGDPLDVRGIFGRANFDKDPRELRLSLSPELQQGFEGATSLGNRRLGELNSMNFQRREQAELGRLQGLRAPQIEQARQGLQSRLLSRGRLGLATGGGVSQGLFNPETAALEEAIMRAQLGDIGAARQFSQQEQGFLQNSAQGAFGLAGNIGDLPNRYAALGISAGRNADQGLAAAPGFAKAATTQGFFSGLGNAIPGLFGGGGDGGGFGGGSPALPPGARPNGLGGLFL